MEKQLTIFNLRQYEKPTKDKTTAIHNFLIWAQMRLSPMGYRIFLETIFQLKKEDEDFHEYHIPVKYLIGKSMDGRSYKMLDKACEDLTAKSVNVMSLDNEHKGFRWLSVVEEAMFIPGKSYVKIIFSRKMKPYLLKVKENYTIIPYDQIQKIGGQYADRLYMILKSEYLGRSLDIGVDDLKEIFFGSGKNISYEKYFMFKTRVIDVCQKELEVTDMAFNYEEIKSGRKVSALRFTLKNTKVIHLNPLTDALQVRLKKLGVSEGIQIELGSMIGTESVGVVFSEQYLNWLCYLCETQREKLKIKKPGGWVVTQARRFGLAKQYLKSMDKTIPKTNTLTGKGKRISEDELNGLFLSHIQRSTEHTNFDAFVGECIKNGFTWQEDAEGRYLWKPE